MATCATSNPNPIIVSVMKDHKIEPEEIPDEDEFNILTLDGRSRRYFEVRGFGRFNTLSHQRQPCPRIWSSFCSWCVIDLKRQIVCHKTKQQCRSCKEWVIPDYDYASLKTMVVSALKLYLEKVASSGDITRQMHLYQTTIDYLWPVDDDDDDGPPHDEARCEKCLRLGKLCYKKPVSYDRGYLDDRDDDDYRGDYDYLDDCDYYDCSSGSSPASPP